MTSSLIVSSITGPSGAAVSFPNGINFGSGTSGANINSIGVPGGQGFGVGICPNLPSGYSTLSGTTDPASSSYGNYMYSDGSICVWIPAFYYKWGTGTNGLAINAVSIQPFSAYTNVAAANAAGYALHRAFYDAGAVQQGVFVDKYLCSQNGSTAIASSLYLGKPLSSASTHNPFSLVGAANAYYGAVDAAKTRGGKWFCCSQFIRSALAMLSYAHGLAATSTTWCAWYDSTGVTNFPKGNNNNAFGDANDATLTFVSDGYASGNSSLTGSANIFNRTTHNGQACGITDLNGDMWEISPGIVTDDAGTTFYVLNTSATMHLMTSGDNALSTDLWGATGIAAWYTALGATYGALTASSTQKTMGSTAQVFDASTSGLGWSATGLGVPLVGGVGGTNSFGMDGLLDYRVSTLCPISGGDWTDGSAGGVWALALSNTRTYSYDYVGFRAASYL